VLAAFFWLVPAPMFPGGQYTEIDRLMVIAIPPLALTEIWLAALEKLLAERGLLQPDELATGQVLHAAPPLPRRLLAADVGAALARGSPTRRNSSTAARFQVGDMVRTRAAQVPHHSRLPAYACGKLGRIERLHGAHVFAEAHAQAQGEQPQPLYTVVFEGTALWGPDATPGLQVSVDAWDSTLEPATPPGTPP
jgi:nitrile hydratase